MLESHLNEIQELVRSARNEKAELHSLIGSVEGTFSDSGGTSLGQWAQNSIDDLHQEYDQVKTRVDQVVDGTSRAEELLHKAIVLRIGSQDRTDGSQDNRKREVH